MIQEIKLNGLDNKPIKTTKKPPPRSTRLKPVVSFSARDTVHPVREIHSSTPVWPGAEYILPIGVGPTRLHGVAWGRRRVSPAPLRALGPTATSRVGHAGRVPPALPSYHTDHLLVGGDAADPTGAARAPSEAKVTWQRRPGPAGPGCRLVERSRSWSGRGPGRRS